MWHAQRRRLQAGIAPQQNVQIQRARRIAVRALTPCRLLDGLQCLQKILGWQLGLQLCHSVQVIRAGCIHRRTAVQRRHRLHLRVRQRGHRQHGLAQRLTTIPQISAQADKYLHAHSAAPSDGPAPAGLRRRRRRFFAGASSSGCAPSGARAATESCGADAAAPVRTALRGCAAFCF